MQRISWGLLNVAQMFSPQLIRFYFVCSSSDIRTVLVSMLACTVLMGAIVECVLKELVCVCTKPTLVDTHWLHSWLWHFPNKVPSYTFLGRYHCALSYLLLNSKSLASVFPSNETPTFLSRDLVTVPLIGLSKLLKVAFLGTKSNLSFHQSRSLLLLD